MSLSKVVVIAITLSCLCCLSGCESLIEDAFKTQKQRDAEEKAIRANPNALNEEAEWKAKAKNLEDTRNQEKNEEANKIQLFNDMLEKQLRNKQ